MRNITINKLMQEASLKIEKNEIAELESVISEVLSINPNFIDAHNIREKYQLKGNFSTWMGVNSQISCDDDIFRFFANHPSSKNPIRDYLADGWRTMIELQDVLDQYGISTRQCNSFLEFASGQGRFTRHLARIYNGKQLTVSDVVPGSVDFLKETFGVNGFYSSNDPAQLHIPGKYEVIFVLSLFSHLPLSVWRSWLRILYASLETNGVLIFSTHGEKCARQEGVDWGEAGCKFYPSSESSVLDGQTYGTTYASQEYVTQAIFEALGPTAITHVVPGHFWGNQDAVVVSQRKPIHFI